MAKFGVPHSNTIDTTELRDRHDDLVDAEKLSAAETKELAALVSVIDVISEIRPQDWDSSTLIKATHFPEWFKDRLFEEHYELSHVVDDLEFVIIDWNKTIQAALNKMFTKVNYGGTVYYMCGEDYDY